MDKSGIENPSKSKVIGCCGGDEKNPPTNVQKNTHKNPGANLCKDENTWEICVN